ncbi:MAG TPA: universal stress protein [Cyclobacteriaceae bacterium]|nr:universal stress protein [Cyclobacteriaceae bacterium]
MKKILVLTDFSACATAAANAAIKIARKAQAEIYFIHFHESVTVSGHVHVPAINPESGEQKELMGALKNALQTLVIEADHAGVKATPILVTNPDETPKQYIESLHADLIVMGSHGVKGIKEIFVGSNTQRVIRQTNIPVLVVKKTVLSDFRKILFAYDFQEDLIKPFEMVLDFTNLWKADLDLLFVNVPFRFKGTEEVTADIRRFMHQFPRANYSPHIYNAFDEVTGIHNFAREHQADLVAVVTHGKTGFNRLLSHSVAESVINHEEIPVLVVNIGRP